MEVQWQAPEENFTRDTSAIKHHKSYRQLSNISDTKSQNLNVSRLVLQLYLPNPLKPGVK